MQPYEQLEKQFGEWAGTPHAVACNSGTSALHLALEALALPRGSEVLVPDFTMIACARACTLAGLKPVFVDCTSELLLDPTKLIDAVTENTMAVMPVHIYGRQCGMTTIAAFAKHYDLYVIEDMAEAHGIDPHKDTHAACWSFYKNKIIAGEEGGLVSFQRAEIAKRAKSLRSLGFTEAHDFEHIPRGMNYRLANCQAELILKSLAKADQNLASRKRVETYYNEMIPAKWQMPNTRQVVWVYDFKPPIDNELTVEDLVQRMNHQGVAARHAFKPMSTQAEYRVLWTDQSRAYQASKQVMYLPVEPWMSVGDAADIVQVLVEAINR